MNCLRWIDGERFLNNKLQGCGYKSVDWIFSNLAAVIDECTGWVEEALLTKIYVHYSDLVIGMTKDNKERGWEMTESLKIVALISNV